MNCTVFYRCFTPQFLYNFSKTVWDVQTVCAPRIPGKRTGNRQLIHTFPQPRKIPRRGARRKSGFLGNDTKFLGFHHGKAASKPVETVENLHPAARASQVFHRQNGEKTTKRSVKRRCPQQLTAVWGKIHGKNRAIGGNIHGTAQCYPQNHPQST